MLLHAYGLRGGEGAGPGDGCDGHPVNQVEEDWRHRKRVQSVAKRSDDLRASQFESAAGWASARAGAAYGRNALQNADEVTGIWTGDGTAEVPKFLGDKK